MRIEYLNVNTYKQGTVVVDKDLSKPLLIFVHGGPGSPEFFIFEKKCPEIFEHFICCFPEQRGAGISRTQKLTERDLKVDTVVADTIAITEHYLQKYHKEKAYIVGHSWGSIVAPHIAKKRPDLFYAYIGIGQVNNQYLSEKMGYDFIIEQSRKYNNKKVLQRLLANDPTNEYLLSMSYMRIRSSELSKYGKAMWHKEKLTTMELGRYMMTSRVYPKNYLIKFLLGNADSLKYGLPLLKNIHLEKEIEVLEIPMYIMQGYHDLQTSFSQASLFYENVSAPEKQFFVFHESAHCPMIDEPQKFIETIKQIIN